MSDFVADEQVPANVVAVALGFRNPVRLDEIADRLPELSEASRRALLHHFPGRQHSHWISHDVHDLSFRIIAPDVSQEPFVGWRLFHPSLDPGVDRAHAGM